MTVRLPGEIELISHFSRHLGPRFEEAGVRVQFHYNQTPGVHFKAKLSGEYQAAVLHGIAEGMAIHFPDFPESGSVWITEAVEHEVNSSVRAFYLAARLVIEQARSLIDLSKAQQGIQRDDHASGGSAR